jgi:hypothetical protein
MFLVVELTAMSWDSEPFLSQDNGQCDKAVLLWIMMPNGLTTSENCLHHDQKASL